jgi:hypothetical protein
MSTFLIGAVALFFAAMGLYGLATPTRLVRPFGIELSSADGHSEVRAVYGGFGLAIAAVLVLATARGGHLREGVLFTVIAALVGMAAGRVVSLFVWRWSRFYPTGFYLAVELVLAGALLAAC